jgi:hypothetical protein
VKYNIDITELARLYTDENLTGREIAARLGIPSRTIQRYLKNAGIPLRNPGKPVIHQLEDRDWLERRYVAEQSSTPTIAAELGCSNVSVSLWLERHGIKPRPTGSERGHKRNDSAEVREKMSRAKDGMFLGPGNPNWRGGIQSRDPDRGRYPAKMWVKAVKDRDGRKCVECGSDDRLHAHHIKQWSDYPELRCDVSNGVTLCQKCHEKVHGRDLKYPLHKQAEKPTSAPHS